MSGTKDLTKANVFDTIGNYFTGNLDFQRQLYTATRAEQHSAAEAQKTRDWQEYMSNTAYSRAIADLKKNGINPYAIGAFAPASTPTGATGSAYQGNQPLTPQAMRDVMGFVETAYKERKATQRELFSGLIDILSNFLTPKSNQSKNGF